MHNRLTYKDSSFIFNKSYNLEGPELNEAWHNNVIIYHRKLSTYINTPVEVGFSVEKVIEDVILPENASDDPSKWYSTQRAELVPASFIMKAAKK
ncbi:hypothetical protein SAMN05877753_104269 [Bacillus oleivorans]|uniref:Uncharacterized protein n=2 Tax=Bacillus oleivorans TaxID=1448271 RepID=A0A285CT28_9BACI|nr:hypothetical protein [Bacillus oleivorans]SNX70701.1 hypothetical protein SAMN05877753_104269 [Bacillus oleivorans]